MPVMFQRGVLIQRLAKGARLVVEAVCARSGNGARTCENGDGRLAQDFLAAWAADAVNVNTLPL
jgi:hypothetical protein